MVESVRRWRCRRASVRSGKMRYVPLRLGAAGMEVVASNAAFWQGSAGAASCVLARLGIAGMASRDLGG